MGEQLAVASCQLPAEGVEIWVVSEEMQIPRCARNDKAKEEEHFPRALTRARDDRFESGVEFDIVGPRLRLGTCFESAGAGIEISACAEQRSHADEGVRVTHNPKLVGERAELLFLYEAACRGFIVSKPFGDSASYDAIVQSREEPEKMWRVQVRSVMRRNGRCYKVDCRTGCRRRKMTPDDADFLAAYCGPEERWYIVPVRAFAPCNHISLFPHVRESEGRWERYREAWELMQIGTST